MYEDFCLHEIQAGIRGMFSHNSMHHEGITSFPQAPHPRRLDSRARIFYHHKAGNFINCQPADIELQSLSLFRRFHVSSCYCCIPVQVLTRVGWPFFCYEHLTFKALKLKTAKLQHLGTPFDSNRPHRRTLPRTSLARLRLVALPKSRGQG